MARPCSGSLPRQRLHCRRRPPTQFASGSFDGLVFSADGATLYAVGVSPSPDSLALFDRTGHVTKQILITGNHGVDGVAVAPPKTFANGNAFVTTHDGLILQIDPTQASPTPMTAADNGSRGDLMTVGPDRCLYATQSDRVQKLLPCVFQPTLGCDIVINGTFTGNLDVDTGTICIIGGTVTGNVKQSGGKLITSYAVIQHNLQVSGGSLSLQNTTFGNNVDIEGIPTGTGLNEICGNSVGNNLTYKNNGVAVEIGSTLASCPGNSIGNNLQCSGNSPAPTGSGNTALQKQNQCATF